MDSDGLAGGNVEGYSLAEEVDRYEKIADDGFSPRERKVVDRYFRSGGSVLDLGCGVGRTTVPLEERGFDVVGADVSEEAIRRARSHFPDLEFEVADAAALPFDDESFEHVLFSSFGLDYTHPETQRHRALEEIKRVLDPGGLFAFSSHNTWYRFPAVALDHGYLKTFYLNRSNRSRLFSRYKRHEDDHVTFESYFTNPIRQRRQLRRHGFETVSVVGKRDGVSRFLEIAPHYVARKV
ncbi:class I SAM-dependent methyltransferase [Natrialbaceae archaeon A-gly3]